MSDLRCPEHVRIDGVFDECIPCLKARLALAEKVVEAAGIAQKWMADNVSLGQAAPDCGPEPISAFDHEMNEMAGLLAVALAHVNERIPTI